MPWRWWTPCLALVEAEKVPQPVSGAEDGRCFVCGRWFFAWQLVKAVAAVFLSHGASLAKFHSVVGRSGYQGGRCAVTETTSQSPKLQSSALLTKKSIKNAQSHWAEHQGP